jgi:hypothetical protein
VRYARTMRVRAVIAVVVLGVASRAQADEPKTATGAGSTGTVATPGVTFDDDASANRDWLMKRKHTLAELELGFIALPNAPISPGQRGGNLPIGTIGHGDATATVGIHFLYRGGSDWEIGAGALFSPLPTSDNTYGGASGLARTHSRSYLWLGTEARYIPLHLKTLEGWVGFAIGGIVVADRFDTAATPVPPILGSNEVTVRTEGGSVGVQAGGDWAFSERLSLGIAARLDHWILPAEATCTPIGDCSTLTGPVAEIEFGIRLGYRIPL